MKKTSGSRSPKFSFFCGSFLTLFDTTDTLFFSSHHFCPQITKNNMGEKCSLFSFSEEENTLLQRVLLSVVKMIDKSVVTMIR